MLVDSHCHLSDAQFDDDRSEVLARAWESGVRKILSIASDRRDAEKIAAYLDGEGGSGPRSSPEAEPRVWGTGGVHPHEAEGAREGDLDAVRDLLRAHDGLVAVGETGLDFFYEHSPRDLQETLFRGHMEIAEALGLPIIVHSRSADGETARIIGEWGDRVRGVLHCFTGGEGLLEKALRTGWMVSFTGIITFKSYEGRELVRRIPRERLMVETDSPYLAPVPHRGRRNEPAFVERVAEALAALRGESLHEVREYTSANATLFFNLTP